MTIRQLIISGHALLGLAAASAIWLACAGAVPEGPTVARVAPFAARLAADVNTARAQLTGARGS
jgi:hypothetical protein